ncbi:hypothetical protein Tco_0980633 [Tanacetum coccineum]
MNDGIFLNQSKCIGEIFKNFGLENSKITNTPVPRKRDLTLDKDNGSIDSTKYRGMIGSLLYLTASTPDIMFSVCLCARFQEDPKVSDVLSLCVDQCIIYGVSDEVDTGILQNHAMVLNSSKSWDTVVPVKSLHQLAGDERVMFEFIIRDFIKSETRDNVKEPLSLRLNEDEHSIGCENITHMMNALKEARMESREILLSIHHIIKMLLDIISKMNRNLEDEKIKMNDKGKGK